MNAPCQFCSSRWVTDSDRCHNHCDAYREYYVMTKTIIAQRQIAMNTKQVIYNMSKSHKTVRREGGI